MQWAEEHIGKDFCRLNSKLASTTNTQIESSYVAVIKFDQDRGREICLGMKFFGSFMLGYETKMRLEKRLQLLT